MIRVKWDSGEVFEYERAEDIIREAEAMVDSGVHIDSIRDTITGEIYIISYKAELLKLTKNGKLPIKEN